jgi:hypothetical protein
MPTRAGGCCRWRRTDLKRLIAARFGVDDHERAIGHILTLFRFSHISARPPHPAQGEQTIHIDRRLKAVDVVATRSDLVILCGISPAPDQSKIFKQAHGRHQRVFI